MAHFAKLDSNNKVINVECVDNQYILDGNGNESENVGINFLHTIHNNNDRYVQTSVNNNFRFRYAGIGYTYDETLDAFIAPKPHSSWTLNNLTADWEPPVPYPSNEDGKYYAWDENKQEWIECQ